MFTVAASLTEFCKVVFALTLNFKKMLQIEEKLGSIRLNCLCSSFFFLFLLVVFFFGCVYGDVPTTTTDVCDGGIFYIKMGGRKLLLIFFSPSSPSHLLVALFY